MSRFPGSSEQAPAAVAVARASAHDGAPQPTPAPDKLGALAHEEDAPLPEVAARDDIRSIPTLMLFAGGRPVARTAGAMDARGIVAWTRAHVPAA